MYMVILVLFYFLFPALLIYATSKSTFLYKVGAVVLAYGIGLLLGNIGIFPAVSDMYHQLVQGQTALPADQVQELFSKGTITYHDVVRNQIASVQDMITTITIPLAIPLLLFSLDIRKWFRLAGTTFLSLILALISVVVVVFAGYFIFRSKIPELGKIAGMLIGIYSGGTPNLAAIKTALNVDPDIFIMTHTTDIVIGAVCLLFLLTVAQRFFRIFLPPFKFNNTDIPVEQLEQEAKEMDDYSGIFSRRIFPRLLLAFGLSILIFATGGALGLLAGEKSMMAVVILTITTLGLGLALIPAINRIEKTYQTGMYLIIVFCLVVSSMADLRRMLNIEYLDLMMYVALVYFGSLLIHIFLSMIFRIDSDTVIITSTALIYSPPFVPVVAGALRNREVIISGLTTGIIGYVIGNYLGIFTGFFLTRLG
ncbi:MAG: DUF819 family protein [Chlorobi bacterium]|nr:DUF819 family protein [Chlorobiota bacterium]